jgi:hypothetical protein
MTSLVANLTIEELLSSQGNAEIVGVQHDWNKFELVHKIAGL